MIVNSRYFVSIFSSVFILFLLPWVPDVCTVYDFTRYFGFTEACYEQTN